MGFFFGLQLPFSPCILPGVGSKPGQQAFAAEVFFAPFPAAVFFAGVFFVSAPVMWLRFAAVFVPADFVAPLGGVRFFAADFLAALFFAADFVAVAMKT